MKLAIAIQDDSGALRFSQVLDVPEELFEPADSGEIALDGVRTAIDYVLYEQRKQKEKESHG